MENSYLCFCQSLLKQRALICFSQPASLMPSEGLSHRQSGTNPTIITFSLPQDWGCDGRVLESGHWVTSEIFPTSLCAYRVLYQGHDLGAARLCAREELQCSGEALLGTRSLVSKAPPGMWLRATTSLLLLLSGPAGNRKKAQADTSLMDKWEGWVAAE